jgi:hypothetical protein
VRISWNCSTENLASLSRPIRGQRFRKHSRSVVKFLRDHTDRERMYRPLEFHKRSQLLIGPHNETLAAAVRLE